MRTSQRLEGAVMHAAVRPYATAGVALVGASVIAVAPVTAPLPDIHIASVHVSAVELTQLSMNPIIGPYITLVTDTVANLVGLAQRAVEFPIASVVIANQLAYATALAGALQSSAMALVTGLQGLPAALQSALTDLTMGDIADAINGIYGALFDTLLLTGIPLLEGVSSVGTAVAGNIGATLQALLSPQSLEELVLIPIFFVNSTVPAFAATAQAFFTAITTGDLVTAATVLLTAPAVLLDANLNGFNGLFGVLTVPGGAVADILNVRDLIAAAIVPFVDPGGVVKPKTSALAQANQVPASVTSNAAATTHPPAGGSDTTKAPTVGSGPVTKVLTSLNATATATAPTPVMANGNKAAPGTVGGNGTTAGAGLTNAVKAAGDQVTSTFSKIGGGLKAGKSGSGK